MSCLGDDGRRLHRQLVDSGFRVMESSLDEMLSSFVDFSPELVLIELGETRAAAADLAHRIRDTEQGYAVPLYFFGKGKGPNPAEVVGMGGDLFLQTPVDTGYLVGKLGYLRPAGEEARSAPKEAHRPAEPVLPSRKEIAGGGRDPLEEALAMAASLPEQKEPAEGGERRAERGRAERGRSASGQESLADLLPPDAGLDEESSGELPPDIDPFADQCRPPAVIPDGLRPPKLPHDDTLTTDVGEPKAVFADTWAWHERSAKEAIDTDSSLGELLPKAPEVGDDAEPKEGRRPAIRRRADEEEMRSMVGDDSRRVHGSEESISENPKAQATEEVLEGALDGEGGSLGGDSLEVADGRGLLPSLHEMLPDEPGSSDGGEFDLDALDVGSTIPGVESSGLRDLPDPSAGALGLDAPGLDMESLEAGWDSEDTDPWQEEASQGGEGWSVDRGPISAEHSVVSSPDQTQPPIEPERTFEPHGHPRGAVSSPGPQAEEIGKKGTEVIDTGGPGDERDTVVGHKKAAELEQLDEQQDEESEQLSGDEPKKPASGGTDPVVELIGGPGARFRAGPQRLEGERAARAFAPKEREVLEALEAETSLEEIAARLEVDIGEIARLARTGLLLGALERAGEEKGGSQPESRSVDGSGDGGEERHQDQKRRVLEMVEGVENLDYFTLLGVASDADEDEIRRAGEKLKREFSDERLPERVRQELADQIAEIRSELDDAISVLCHPRYGPAYRKALGEVAGDDKSDE